MLVDSYYFIYTYGCRTLRSLQNTEVVLSLVYNEGNFLWYNSTENTVTAYSEPGSKWAREFNSWRHKEAEKVISDCREYGRQLSVVNKAVRPRVMLRSLRPASGDQPAVLMCSAYDFYPKPITLTWLRDGEKVTADVVSTEELTDGDWHHQIHSQLEFTPEPAENISCMVERLSFREPALFHWSHSDA
ncbi:rano class II histocompatibility antigen, A beta chain-like [Colossoma macropomum]|uniref:rano class II histocompatibility antigen, A beta chain-like n=1 Tax=Colossoma macropomum TaxID=42526 RepID=UPI001863AA36|nr:rano class II histocompatibility antigen, A beta chain-like [Colossoma macropomum]